MVNWPVVELADASVVLVADIDRGGIFAQVIGTLDLLAPHERQRVLGVIVNKFRGDCRLFEDGVRILEARTGLPILFVIERCCSSEAQRTSARQIAAGKGISKEAHLPSVDAARLI